jgi:hypothetical protein
MNRTKPIMGRMIVTESEPSPKRTGTKKAIKNKTIKINEAAEFLYTRGWFMVSSLYTFLYEK